jgi:hypothetical protein
MIWLLNTNMLVYARDGVPSVVSRLDEEWERDEVVTSLLVVGDKQNDAPPCPLDTLHLEHAAVAEDSGSGTCASEEGTGDARRQIVCEPAWRLCLGGNRASMGHRDLSTLRRPRFWPRSPSRLGRGPRPNSCRPPCPTLRSHTAFTPRRRSTCAWRLAGTTNDSVASASSLSSRWTAQSPRSSNPPNDGRLFPELGATSSGDFLSRSSIGWSMDASKSLPSLTTAAVPATGDSASDRPD